MTRMLPTTWAAKLFRWNCQQFPHHSRLARANLSGFQLVRKQNLSALEEKGSSQKVGVLPSLLSSVKEMTGSFGLGFLGFATLALGCAVAVGFVTRVWVGALQQPCDGSVGRED